jgi:hypothetical protein
MRSLICLFLCLAASPAGAAPSLVGTWFGQGQPDSKQSMYLDHFLANGQIHSQFRDCIKGKAYDSAEDGTWSVAGDILTVRVTLHDGVPAPRTDYYRITSVTAKQLKHVYVLLNFPYDEHRVDDRFTLPSCELVS